MKKIQSVVTYYKTRENLSFRKFADALNECIPQGKVSHQTIKHWVDGRSEPRLGTMLLVSHYATKTDWCVEMAEDVISIIEKKLETK